MTRRHAWLPGSEFPQTCTACAADNADRYRCDRRVDRTRPEVTTGGSRENIRSITQRDSKLRAWAKTYAVEVKDDKPWTTEHPCARCEVQPCCVVKDTTVGDNGS